MRYLMTSVIGIVTSDMLSPHGVHPVIAKTLFYYALIPNYFGIKGVGLLQKNTSQTTVPM